MVQVKTETISIPELMKALRNVMAKEISASRRLNAILTLLCEQLHMPTAVLYLTRPGDVLERYVLVGKEMKLPAFVRMGEDIVGKTALERKIQQNTDSSTKLSLAVPVVRGSELLAVLQLISKRKNGLEIDVVEAVQNVAMVLAEFLTDAISNKAAHNLGNLSVARTLEGISMVPGFALGEVLLHRRLDVSGPILSASPDRELKRLNDGFVRLQMVINRRLSRPSIAPEEKELFETYALFLADPDWKARIVSAINTGLTAQAALQKIGDEMLDRMRAISDPYLRERAHDFQDLTARLMQVLVQKRIKKKLSGSKILVADSLGAAELLDYDLKHIKGIVLEDGSQTTHVVIVARAYRIPLIGGVNNATRQLEEADPIALDGTAGKVYLRPTDETLDSLKIRRQSLARMEKLYIRNQDKPTETKDEIPVSLMLNMGLATRMDKLPPSDGIGLYRTELLFMTAKSLPDIRTQTEAYKRILVMAKNKPVVFRTLDIGSDKVLPYFEQQNEENPAMGWRSIRMALDRRALLRNQLRALLRATAGKTLHVMFPMITDVSEFIEAKQTLEIEMKNAMQHKEKTPKQIIVGTMLEVPALIFQLDNLLPLVDFISIGTNDLAQFMFAADRTNPQIANRYDALSPAFLKAINVVLCKCAERNVHCSICGEMASRPLDAVTLIGLGARTLSMSPEAVGAVKAAIRTLNLKKFEQYLLSQLDSCQPTLRQSLFAYLRDHKVQLGEF